MRTLFLLWWCGACNGKETQWGWFFLTARCCRLILPSFYRESECISLSIWDLAFPDNSLLNLFPAVLADDSFVRWPASSLWKTKASLSDTSCREKTIGRRSKKIMNILVNLAPVFLESGCGSESFINQSFLSSKIRWYDQMLSQPLANYSFSSRDRQVAAGTGISLILGKSDGWLGFFFFPDFPTRKRKYSGKLVVKRNNSKKETNQLKQKRGWWRVWV